MHRKGRLEALARSRVAAVWNDPEGRLALRKEFYAAHGQALGEGYGYGNSEIAFTEWEVRRGVLAPDNGSPWWKDMNGDLLYYSELAAIAYANDAEDLDWSTPVRLWLDYIQKPNAQSWYKAHNGSICRSYPDRTHAARAEDAYEQTFLNIVLYRLLYAQALVEGVSQFGEWGEIIANPILPAVDVLVHIPDFYPDTYPMTHAEYNELMGKDLSLEELAVYILDQVLILPTITELYRQAAVWNLTPEIIRLLDNGEPIYPQVDPLALPPTQKETV